MQFQTENILNDLNSVKTAAALGLTAGSGFVSVTLYVPLKSVPEPKACGFVVELYAEYLFVGSSTYEFTLLIK